MIVCGDGDYDAAALVELAEQAGWPVLAEPSSGARRGPNALTGYQYLLASPEFMAAHRPEVIVSAGRPGLTRPQPALLAASRAPGRPPSGTSSSDGPRDVGRPHSEPRPTSLARSASPVLPAGFPSAGSMRGAARTRRRPGRRGRCSTRRGCQRRGLSEPDVARELVAALPENAMLWCGNLLSVRDIDLLLPPRADTRVIASRGASGIDGTFSSAAGAALAHAAEHPGAAAFALIGDLSLLPDAPGLAIGPGEPRPDLCVVVVNNDGGGIFAGLEPAAVQGRGPAGRAERPSVFERVFGTSHGASLEQLAAAFGMPYALAEGPGDLAKAVAPGSPAPERGSSRRRTGRAANEDLRARMRAAGVAAAGHTSRPSRSCGSGPASSPGRTCRYDPPGQTCAVRWCPFRRGWPAS